MALILLALGTYVLLRFTLKGLPKANLGKPLGKKFLTPLGVVAGFVDSTGGGGWGPVGTPAILASGRLEPRKTIGSIDTSEFLVAVAASIGFIIGIGTEGMDYTWVSHCSSAASSPHRSPRGWSGTSRRGSWAPGRRRDHPDQQPHPAPSDWIGAPEGTRYVFYVAIYRALGRRRRVLVREYRKNREEERRIIAEAEAVAVGGGQDRPATAPTA